MTRPILEPAAEEDLLAIWEYIAADSPAAADRVLDRIAATIGRLGEMPSMGHQRPDITSLPLRFFSSGGVTIIYRCDSDPIRIIRISGKGRDLSSLI